MTTCRCSKGLYHISLSSKNKYLTCQLVVPSAQSLMGAISQGLGMEKGYVEIVRRLSFIRWFIASPRDPAVTLYTRVLTVSQVGTEQMEGGRGIQGYLDFQARNISIRSSVRYSAVRCGPVATTTQVQSLGNNSPWANNVRMWCSAWSIMGNNG